MKFIEQIIIGLVIFNGMLILTSPFFPATTTDTPFDAVNVTSESDYSRYEGLSLDFWGLLFSTGGLGFAAFGGAVGIGALFVFFSRDIKVLGIAAIAGLVTGTFIGTAGILSSVSTNVYIQGLIALIGIAIGILFAIYLSKMMAGQGVTD